ncbi:MAG: ArnT family glycosyltransferase, partial [Dehalococcoidia bacterium]
MAERGTAIESAPPDTVTAGARFPLPAALVGPALLAVLGAALVLVITARVGPGLTPDSVTYLAAARSLRDGEGYRAPDGEPYVAFPPLYPTMIAALSLGGIEPETAARLLDAVSFGVVILATGWAVGRITTSTVYAALGAGAVLVSTPVLDSALHIWSESLFTALTMIALGCLVLRSEPRSAGAMAGAWVASALAALTRYIGVVVPLTHAAVELSDRATPVAIRLRRAGIALLALAPLLLWLGRNLAVSGTLVGERYPSATSFSENAQATAETI